MDSPRNLQGDLESLRLYFRCGRTKEASWRKTQIKGLLNFIKENEGDIMKALKQDLGKHRAEAYRDEIGTLIKSLNYALNSLKAWMSPKKVKLPAVAVLTTAELLPEPLGLVLIVSAWNFPFGLSLEPLIGALAAGNTAVLKPSELAPACSSLLANTMTSYLDGNAVKVVEGGPSVGEQLLQERWDKIFFTGNARVGRIVMSAAVKYLTPVALELGGKCPAVLDSLSFSFDREVAVKRILVGKFGTCAGQACITIDYVLVEKKFLPKAVELMKAITTKMFGENPRETNTVARIVNRRHFLRLKNLLDDPTVKASIVYGGKTDEENLFIEPTILVDPPLEAEIMTEEIFGPLLPIITLENIEDSIEFIKARPRPLTIYAFTKSKTLERKLVSETSSGSLVFNDAIIQYAADTIPFGGVGESGIGRYHGKFSFDTFSHEKAVARRSFLVDFWFRFPPWNDYKLQLFREAYNFDYLGVIFVVLGLKKPKSDSHVV
ncbi:Aldehyde dehydrogenase family 3 member F1 [Morus notabilis]|uniref:Aldehyde dehydrogenase n=1 Tax=Morus notabilis TaxID=981085 RepID=W9RI97_9ROSA|nr:aldehyde dehydrogenase family 3 member F1 [Morus notabilis]EXB93296.1 Aldehyde dehydrogenase family 3 member F1 [Morus notabilis]